MNATDNGREARSRATRRLRRLTIGTAALGVAATGGFGWLAAMTYDGAAVTATTTTTTTTVTNPAATGSATTSTPAGTTSSSSTSTTYGTVTVPTVQAASGPAHASTGGS